MAVLIPIVTQYAGKGMDRALKEFKSLESASDRAGFILKRALVPAAIAATGAAIGLGKVLFDAAKAAAEDERSQAMLARQLRATTGATDDQIAAVDDFIGKLELAAGVSDEQLRPAMATLTRSTGDTRRAQQQLTLAMDIAAGTGKDLASVSVALAKANQGNFTAFTRLGVPIDENIVKTKDLKGLHESLARQFAGASSTAANTFSGQMERLKIGFGNLQESLGRIVLPYLTRFVDLLNRYVVPALQVFIDQLRGGKGVKGSFEVAIASMGDFGPMAVRAMRTATEAVFEFVKAIALAYAGIQTLIGAAQALATRGKAGLPAFAAALAAASGAAVTDVVKNKTLKYFDSLEKRLGTLASQAGNSGRQMEHTADRLDRMSAAALAAQAALGGDDEEGGGGAGKGAGKAVDRLAERAKALQKRLEEAAKALRDDMGEALSDAEQRLNDATKAFDEFAGSVSKTIRSALNFGDALKDSAEDGGGSFFDELNKQAERAQEFGDLVEQLLKAGISEQALQEVLAAGVNSGTAIARELLAATDGVLRANKLVETTQAIATKIGEASAKQFYGAGVAAGTAYLEGVRQAVAAAEALIAKAKRPADIKGAAAAFSNTIDNLRTAPPPTNITINSQSLDPREAGEVIVDALRAYNQRAGYIGLNVFAE